MNEEVNIFKCKNCYTENRISRKKLQAVLDKSDIDLKILCKTCGTSLMNPPSAYMRYPGKCREKCAVGHLGQAFSLINGEIPLGKIETDGIYYYMDASTRIYTREEYIKIYSIDPEKYLNWLESDITIKNNPKRRGFK